MNSTERVPHIWVPKPKRRKRGAGSIFYDKSRDRWVGQVDLGTGLDGKRHRKRVVAPDPVTCQALVDDLRKGLVPRTWNCMVPPCRSRSVTDEPVLLCRAHLEELLKQVAPKKSDGPAVIYFARNGSLIKIGWSVNARQRLRQLALPQDSLIGTIPGTREDELELHHRFASSRVGRSEWFAVTPELLELLGSHFGNQELSRLTGGTS